MLVQENSLAEQIVVRPIRGMIQGHICATDIHSAVVTNMKFADICCHPKQFTSLLSILVMPHSLMNLSKGYDW